MREPESEPPKQVDGTDVDEIELRLRSKVSLEELNAMAARGIIFSRAQMVERFGASPGDIDTVAAFAERAGLTVAATDAGARSVRLQGASAQLARAFGMTLRTMTIEGRPRRVRIGAPAVPGPLKGIVLGVEGLDMLPLAQPYFARRARTVDRMRLMRT